MNIYFFICDTQITAMTQYHILINKILDIIYLAFIWRDKIKKILTRLTSAISMLLYLPYMLGDLILQALIFFTSCQKCLLLSLAAVLLIYVLSLSSSHSPYSISSIASYTSPCLGCPSSIHMLCQRREASLYDLTSST